MRPTTHSSVELRHLSGMSHAAEVTFLTEGYVALSRPETYPAGEAPSGEQFELVWPAGQAVNILTVTVTERPGRGDEVVWEAVANGEVRTQERRPHARAQLHTPLTIAADTTPRLESSEAMLTDLSEDSLRAAVYGREWAELEAGTSVHLGFLAANTYFQVHGSVLRTYGSKSEDDDGVEIIVLLSSDEQTTKDLRLAVLAERQDP